MEKQELTLGQVRAMYFDEDALRLPELPMYRFDIRGGRNYFTLQAADDPDKTEPVFFTGITTLTHRMIPKEEALIKWMASMGYDNAIAYRDERALYGTLMHTVFAKFLIDGSVDLNLIDSVVDNYIQTHQLYHISVAAWAHDIKQDLIGFAQFCIDYQIKPLAIEVTLGNPEKRIAGTVDLVCKMTIEEKGYYGEVYKSGAKKGQPKETKMSREVYAIVDFKSGRNSHGGVHNAAQLFFYKDLVHYTWEDITIERMYNWNPKNWRTMPGYTLTNQSETYSNEQADHLLQLFKLENKSPEENTRLTMNGELRFKADIEDNYSVRTIEELAKDRIAEQDGKIEDWRYEDFNQLMA